MLTVEPPLTLEVEILGRRPAGRLDRRQPLLATVRRVRERLGLPDELVAASTDANAALAAGIPALCLGCAQGGEMHTPGEYIEIASLAAGREQLRSVLAELLWDNPAPMTVTPHPLEPLGADELERAVACVRSARGLAEGVRFIFVELREPDKAAARGVARRRPAYRRARRRSSCWQAARRTRPSWRWTTTRSSSFEHVPGVQAAITGDEYAESEIAVKADPGFRRALELRGIHDVELVMVDSWSVGLFEEPGRRVARALSWLRSDLTGDNGYARPIGGLIALVDLNTMQVVRIDDHGALPVPDAPGDYRDGGGRPYRDDLRPIEVTQPEGASFTLDGYALTWGPGARASDSTRASR